MCARSQSACSAETVASASPCQIPTGTVIVAGSNHGVGIAERRGTGVSVHFGAALVDPAHDLRRDRGGLRSHGGLVAGGRARVGGLDPGEHGAPGDPVRQQRRAG
jgi:hypothetical protein